MSKVEVLKTATLTGHRDCIYSLEGSTRSNIFFSSGGDGMVVKWDLENTEHGELIAQTSHSIYALHYLPESDSLLIGENFEGLHWIDLQQRKEMRSSGITDASIFDIKSSEKLIIVATGDGHVVILDKKDLSLILKIRMSDKSARSIAINAPQDQAAIGFSDHSFKILDLRNFSILASVQAHQNSIFTGIYSPDGNYFLTGGRDAHLKVWNVGSSYEQYKSIAAHMFAINHIAYSPDGNYFATCSMDKSIKLWEAGEFRLLKVIDKARHAGHGTSVNKMLWSEYENKLISCSDDRTISIWNINFN